MVITVGSFCCSGRLPMGNYSEASMTTRTLKSSMRLGADKTGNPTSVINGSVSYWLVLMIRDYQILKQKGGKK